MQLVRNVPFFVRAYRLHRQLGHDKRHVKHIRWDSDVPSLPPPPEQPIAQASSEDERKDDSNHHIREAGGMSRRLAQMMDETIEQGGRSTQKSIEEAGFCEELKSRLEAKMLDSKFRSDHAVAFSQHNMPPSAGQGTRGIAAAQPWTGTEPIGDAALRMLTDAHKPLRGSGSARIPTPGISVDLRMKKAVQNSPGERLANARDRMSVYALSQDPSLSDHEKEQMRKVLKERFTPCARPMPGTIQGLAALADERIADAIAQGQFKNITRGKGKNIERDYTASSPFLDTTEYFMNKIIQKQQIVPPWIEKQQELVKAAAVFRSRLRADWKRHAVRVIASKGGTLDEQVGRARAYAAAEAAFAPKTALSGELMDEKRQSADETTSIKGPEHTSSTTNVSESPVPTPCPSIYQQLPLPFRDPSWESIEKAYHTLAISSLNSLTRDYNLQAPTLAKKPYFSLARELNAGFADVAPQLPAELLARSRQKFSEPEKVQTVKQSGGVLERLGGDFVKVVDSTKPHYGFRQFWKDMWGKEAKA